MALGLESFLALSLAFHLSPRLFQEIHISFDGKQELIILDFHLLLPDRCKLGTFSNKILCSVLSPMLWMCFQAPHRVGVLTDETYPILDLESPAQATFLCILEQIP